MRVVILTEWMAEDLSSVSFTCIQLTAFLTYLTSTYNKQTDSPCTSQGQTLEKDCFYITFFMTKGKMFNIHFNNNDSWSCLHSIHNYIQNP